MDASGKRQQGMQNREWGKQAEQIAAEYLIKEGYLIREQNWRVGNTIEIDIIAEKEGTIAFVEVKARKGNVIAGEDAVDKAKCKKIVRGGDIYLRQQKFLYRYRLDVIVVAGSPEQYQIRHYPDAFLPPLNGTAKASRR